MSEDHLPEIHIEPKAIIWECSTLDGSFNKCEPLSAKWYVYMILCNDYSVYVGITTNVDQRYVKHVQGKGAKYTRAHPPIKLLRTWECANRSEASKLEHYFKSLTRPRKLYAVAHGLRYEVPGNVPLIEPE
jgi:putative endonuclease